MVLELLTSKGLLSSLEDGRQVVDLDSDKRKVAKSDKKLVNSDKRVVITKSDGSSLYITRDIAAALDRFQTFRWCYHLLLLYIGN